MALNHYVLFGTDKPGMLAVRQAVRETHRAYIREPGEDGVTVIFAGPTLGDDGQMNGSLLVMLAPSKEAVQRFAAGDPYAKNGLFATVEIREMRAGLVRPDLMVNT